MRRKYKMMTKRDTFESVTSWDLPPICDKCRQVYEMSGFACSARLGQQNAQTGHSRVYSPHFGRLSSLCMTKLRFKAQFCNGNYMYHHNRLRMSNDFWWHFGFVLLKNCYNGVLTLLNLGWPHIGFWNLNSYFSCWFRGKITLTQEVL